MGKDEMHTTAWVKADGGRVTDGVLTDYTFVARKLAGRPFDVNMVGGEGWRHVVPLSFAAYFELFSAQERCVEGEWGSEWWSEEICEMAVKRGLPVSAG